jgi:hypothetical protein
MEADSRCGRLQGLGMFTSFLDTEFWYVFLVTSQPVVFILQSFYIRIRLKQHKSVLILIILFSCVLFKRHRELRLNNMCSSPSIIKTMKSWDWQGM